MRNYFNFFSFLAKLFAKSKSRRSYEKLFIQNITPFCKQSVYMSHAAWPSSIVEDPGMDQAADRPKLAQLHDIHKSINCF